MDEKRAGRVVDRLRQQGIDAHVERASTYQFGVRVALRDGRNAVWDTDGTLGLEAQVMRNGMLVGFVPQLEGSEDFDGGPDGRGDRAHRLRPAHRHPAHVAAAARGPAAPARAGCSAGSSAVSASSAQPSESAVASRTSSDPGDRPAAATREVRPDAAPAAPQRAGRPG